MHFYHSIKTYVRESTLAATLCGINITLQALITYVSAKESNFNSGTFVECNSLSDDEIMRPSILAVFLQKLTKGWWQWQSKTHNNGRKINKSCKAEPSRPSHPHMQQDVNLNIHVLDMSKTQVINNILMVFDRQNVTLIRLKLWQDYIANYQS